MLTPPSMPEKLARAFIAFPLGLPMLSENTSFRMTVLTADFVNEYPRRMLY